MCSYYCASFGRRNRSNISFTFVQENIMSIIGDTTKHSICAPGVAFVDFLGLDIKPEFMCRNRCKFDRQFDIYHQNQEMVWIWAENTPVIKVWMNLPPVFTRTEKQHFASAPLKGSLHLLNTAREAELLNAAWTQNTFPCVYPESGPWRGKVTIWIK